MNCGVPVADSPRPAASEEAVAHAVLPAGATGSVGTGSIDPFLSPDGALTVLKTEGCWPPRSRRCSKRTWILRAAFWLGR